MSFRIQIVVLLTVAGALFASEVGVGQDFRKAVEPLIESSCIHCHDGSEDNGLDFSNLKNDLVDSDTFRKWERIFDRVEKNEMPPASEDRPSKSHKADAIKAIEQALVAENLRFQKQNGRVILRRLTKTEYQYTLNDLLYINAEVSEIIPSENLSSGFDTVFSAQGFSPLHITSYLEAADQALEDAIVLQPKPESKTRKFEFLKSKFVTEHLKKKDEHIVIGETDDAAIMFNTASYLFKIDYHLEYSGIYKIRANASGFQNDRPVVLTFNAGNYNRGFTQILGFFDLEKDKERTLEVESYLTNGQYVFPGAEDLDVQPDGKTIWNVGPETYKGSGVAIKWLELEGPIFEKWPPFSTTNLLKGVKLKKLKNKKWIPKQQTHHQYEVVAPKDPEAQLKTIVAWLAPRAFRRPMVGGEGLPFVELGMNSLKDGGTFDDAIRVACRAVLTSPQFLFMAPEPGKLNDFELASRLSYFLWKSLPDNELFRLARAKKLSDPEVLDEQIERMLDDRKSLRFVKDFSNQWLQLSEINATAPDKKLYPEYDALLENSMLAETKFFLEHLIEKDLSATNLIDSDFAFLNRRLAEHYGIDGVKGQHFRKVKLKKSSPRGGILTHASVLKVTANGTTTSPVTRGSWVLTHLLGQPPSPPPPTIGSIEPDTRGTTTIREMLAKHRNDATCASCHKLIDPPGFALESFDVIGGYRERFRSREKGENVKRKLHGRKIWEYKIGLAVDSSGELPDGKKFDGIKEYKKLLLKEKDQVARNLIAQLMVYSTGAEIQFSDRSEIERILEVCRKSDFGIRTMIHEVIKSKLFLNK